MKKSNYNPGIDFIIVAYYRFEQIKLLVQSIDRYVTGEYTIHIANNGQNEGPGNGYDILTELFKENPNVIVYKGINQVQGTEHINTSYTTKIDGRLVGTGSYTQALAMKQLIKSGNRKYLCYVDGDVIFLNKWVDDILPLLETNVFVSHMWRHDLGQDAQQFVTLKRETVESNYVDEPEDIYPNIFYKDTGGMLSYWALKNKKPFVILKNSFENPELKVYHLLNLKHGQQAWINNVPVMYHYGHGSMREESKYLEWISEASKYLNNETN